MEGATTRSKREAGRVQRRLEKRALVGRGHVTTDDKNNLKQWRHGEEAKREHGIQTIRQQVPTVDRVGPVGKICKLLIYFYK